MPKQSVIALLALSAAISGCGTISNIICPGPNHPPKPFGGIANDFYAVGSGDALMIFDVPGSLVGDVVTLPQVLIANDVFKRPVKSTPVGHNADSEDPTIVLRPNRVSKEVSDVQTVENAPAEQSEKQNR